MTPLLVKEILSIYLSLIVINVVLYFILKMTRGIVSHRLKYIKENIITFQKKPSLLKKFYGLVRQREPLWSLFIPVGYIFCSLMRLYRILNFLNKFEIAVECLINKSTSCDKIYSVLNEMDDEHPILNYKFKDTHLHDIAKIKKEPMYTLEELQSIKISDLKDTSKYDCHNLIAILSSVAHFKGHKDT